MKYEIKNLKTFMGMDCPGYNCALYRDGKRVAEVVDDGSGGEPRFHWLDWEKLKVQIPVANRPGTDPGSFGMYKGTPEEALLQEHVKDMVFPPSEYDRPGEEPLHMGMDGFVGTLVSDLQEQKHLARMVRGKTAYRLVGQAKGEWWTINAPFSKELKARIVLKNGADKIEEFLNERMGQVATGFTMKHKKSLKQILEERA